jgi:large subunit ribosomal protein L22
MGARKRHRAEKIKEQKKNQYFAVLKGCPIAPRKMRLLADQIRGEEVNQALDILRFSPKAASGYMEKLLLSAISNWQNKNEGVRIEDSQLIVSEVRVDEGRTLKRIRPEAMGRAHLIRKRSNHVTIHLENLKESMQKSSEASTESGNSAGQEEVSNKDSQTNQE